MSESKHTPGPWEHVKATEHHGHYVVSQYGTTVCDLYCMSDPSKPSTRNGGTSRPIDFCKYEADANARLIAAAPELLVALHAADEALAQITAFEDDARQIMGNTNFEIVKQRRQEVRAAVAKAGASDALRDPVRRAVRPVRLGWLLAGAEVAGLFHRRRRAARQSSACERPPFVSTKPENPFAFPVLGSVFEPAQQGMTLRDYFAGQALVGLMMKDPYAEPYRHATWAYGAADAMLAQRAKSEDAQ